MVSGMCAGGWVGRVRATRGGTIRDELGIANVAAGEGTHGVAVGVTLSTELGLTLGYGYGVGDLFGTTLGSVVGVGTSFGGS